MKANLPRDEDQPPGANCLYRWQSERCGGRGHHSVDPVFPMAMAYEWFRAGPWSPGGYLLLPSGIVVAGRLPGDQKVTMPLSVLHLRVADP